jgi:hypothetical protein
MLVLVDLAAEAPLRSPPSSIAAHGERGEWRRYIRSCVACRSGAGLEWLLVLLCLGI